MNHYRILILLLAIISFSCSNVDFVNDDVNTDSQLLSADSDFTLDPTKKLNGDFGTSFRLNNGTQEINDQQTNSELERGVGVSIPLFFSQRDPVEVPMGSWVTLRFGLQNLLSQEDCPESLSEEQLNDIMLASEEFVDINSVSISFGGEEIDVKPFFRYDNINLAYGVGLNGPGCYSQVSWRYFLKPQAKGDYTFSFVANGIEYTRTISWVTGK